MIEVCLPGRNVTLGSDLAKKKRREKARGAADSAPEGYWVARTLASAIGVGYPPVLTQATRALRLREILKSKSGQFPRRPVPGFGECSALVMGPLTVRNGPSILS